MTNANDLLWWDDAEGCRLAWGQCGLRVFGGGTAWRWAKRYHIGDGQSHATREAAMQAAVDAAEATGVDFSEAPRWSVSLARWGTFVCRTYVRSAGVVEWWVSSDCPSCRVTGESTGDACSESLARTAAIAALRVEVKKLIEKAKGELGV